MELDLNTVMLAISTCCIAVATSVYLTAAWGNKRKPHTKQETLRKVRIYVDGCWDVMHSGHYNALRQARALGDFLVVGVHSDEEIARVKREPVMNNEQRMAAVTACKWADEVTFRLHSKHCTCTVQRRCSPIECNGSYWDNATLLHLELDNTNNTESCKCRLKQDKHLNILFLVDISKLSLPSIANREFKYI